MIENIERKTRAQIAEFLPDALGKALDTYKAFIKSDGFNKSENFKSNHDAGKAAIAHIELLLKLAKWVGEDVEKETGQGKGLSALQLKILAAQTEMKDHDSE